MLDFGFEFIDFLIVFFFSLEINISGQLALKTENRTLNRFLVQTYLTGIVVLDDHSQEMRCFQNKSINLFLLQR